MAAQTIILAYISFTSPAMLAGLGFAALPIVAHLMNRQARNRRVFPTIQLLQQVVAEQAKVAHLRHWILLVLRCFAIGAIVLAFTRPVWRSDRQLAVDAQQHSDVVLLIDSSASMQTTRRGMSRFERAKARTIQLLGELREGKDQAAVLMMGERCKPIFPDFSANLSGLKDELAKVEAGYEKADPVAGLNAARQFLTRSTGMPRLVIISDLQKSNWQAAFEPGKHRNFPESTKISVVDLDARVAENTSLHFPRGNPKRPLVGQSVTYSAQVTNHSLKVKQVRVQAAIGTSEMQVKTLSLEPGQSRDVAFESTLENDEPVIGRFQLGTDEFTVDDSLSIVTVGKRGIPVAILSDDDPRMPETAGFFVSLALAPFGDKNDRFDIQVLAQRDIAREELDPHAAVFVGYLGQLSSDAAQTLIEYVRDGGAIVCFCGQGPVKRNLDRLQEASNGQLLPFDVGPRQSLTRTANPIQISSGSWRSPILRDFNLPSQIALRDVRFSSRWSVTKLDAAADVLLSFNDDTPALAIRPYGRGQCVLANFSPAVDSSDFGKHGAFVALCQILAQNLSEDDSQPLAIGIGESIGLSINGSLDSSPYTLLKPDQSLTELQQGADTSRIFYDRTDTPGVYAVRDGQRTVNAFAVHVAPEESEVDLLSPDSVAKRLDASTDKSLVVDETEDASTTLSPQSPSRNAGNSSVNRGDSFNLRGRPLWGWLLVMAMAFSGLELGLLARWRR